MVFVKHKAPKHMLAHLLLGNGKTWKNRITCKLGDLKIQCPHQDGMMKINYLWLLIMLKKYLSSLSEFDLYIDDQMMLFRFGISKKNTISAMVFCSRWAYNLPTKWLCCRSVYLSNSMYKWSFSVPNKFVFKISVLLLTLSIFLGNGKLTLTNIWRSHTKVTINFIKYRAIT